MSRVIFLDIDGVLNAAFWNQNHQKEISDGHLIDRDKVKLLAQLIDRADAQIILHSGWRFWFDEEKKPLCTEAERLVEMLAEEGLVIAGFTPDLTTEEIRRTKKFSLVKADEILLWLKMNEDVEGWVVLDDLELHNTCVKGHQVKTDQTVGLSLEDVDEAVEMLARRAGTNLEGR